jgi:hypothetical protein
MFSFSSPHDFNARARFSELGLIDRQVLAKFHRRGLVTSSGRE